MVKKEISKVLHNKLLVATIIAVSIIPIMYAGVFLKSIWDPYGNMDKLPVAVVNLDKSADYNGTTMNVGQEVVDNLKANESLQWHFVTPQEAQDGLKNKNYYMIVTLPEDLSKKATTVLEADPEKMDITYETNGSLNFISEVVSDSAMKTLKSTVSANVTKAYTNAIFDSIKAAGDGMQTAADGASKLDNGANQVNNGVGQLAEKVPTLANGVSQLDGGANTLSNGITQYTSGVDTVAKGATTLNNGVSALAGQIPALTSGIGQLADGSNTLANGLQQYTAGVGTLANGTTTLNQGVSQLSSKIPTLVSGVSQLNTGSGTLSSGLGQLSSQIPMSDEDATKLNAGLTQIQQGISTLNTQVQGIDANQLAQIPVALTGVGGNLTAAGSEVQNLVQNTATAATGLAIQAVVSDTSLSDTQRQALIATIQANAANVSSDANVQSSIGTISSNLSAAGGTLNALSSTALPDISALKTGVATLNAGAEQAIPAASKAVSGLSSVKVALDSQIIPGAQTLNNGLSQLNDQTPALESGVTQLATGVKTLDDGAQTLNSNSSTLMNGTTSLQDGLNTLNSKTPALASGVNELKNGTTTLADGTTTLSSKSGQLNSGASTLSNGLNTLSGNIPALSSGVTQLQTGTDALANGSNELAEKLATGANTLKDTKLTDKTAEMIATPVKVDKEKYSNVPNYGHALAPYFLSVSIFVGCVMFNLAYPIRKIADKNGSAFGWFLSKLTIGGFAATAMAVIIGVVMQAIGLEVAHPTEFFAILIATAWASMFIVMFLAMAFDNPGRFIAMLLLVIQLGASGGTFPLDTSSKFYQMVHPYIPMTYSIYGLREAITSGLGRATFNQSITVLIVVAIVSICLLAFTMAILKRHGKAGYSQVHGTQKLMDDDYSYTNAETQNYSLW